MTENWRCDHGKAADDYCEECERRERNELHVSPEEFGKLRDWALLKESEFLGKVYEKWPWLRELPRGEEVKVIVDLGVN